MTRNMVRVVTAAVGSLVLASWPAVGARARVAQGTGAVQAPAARTAAPDSKQLEGQWRLNRQLSAVPELGETAQEPSQPSQPRGGGFGGHRGGFGGRGGGEGMGGGGGATTMPEDLLKMRAFVRSLAEPASILTILVAPAEVTMTDEQGVVRKFKTDGKKAQIDFGPGANIDTKTTWEAGKLDLEIGSGSLKASETYQITSDGKMLVVTVQPPSMQRNAAQAPIKFVYDRA